MGGEAAKFQEFINSQAFYASGLAVALVVLAVLVHRIRAWYRGSNDPVDDHSEIIREFQELKQRGDLSEEEFRSIKGNVSSRKNQKNGLV